MRFVSRIQGTTMCLFNLFTHNISLVICCLSSPQLPARFSLKAPDVREMGKMTAGKFAIHFFFSYVRRFKIISKNRLFYNHFYLFHLCCLYHDYGKKDFTHLAVRVVNLRNHIKRADGC